MDAVGEGAAQVAANVLDALVEQALTERNGELFAVGGTSDHGVDRARAGEHLTDELDECREPIVGVLHRLDTWPRDLLL